MQRPVRIGLVGLGRWGRVHLRTLLSLSDRCTVTHLCTSRPEHAALVPHPVTVVRTWRALLRAPCDAVVIATPAATHAELLAACVRAGKPCLVEKPLCLDVATATRLDRTVRASGVPVLVNHTHLFDPAYEALKRAVANAGDPIRLIISEGMALGPFRTDVSVLWDRGWHDVSLCLDMMGRLPTRVAALGGPAGPNGFPEQVSLRLEFPGGACAWIQAGCLSVEKRRQLTVFTERRLYRWNAQGKVPLVWAPITFSRRTRGGIPEAPAWKAMRVEAVERPMRRMARCFLDGLHGRARDRFGTTLAVRVTRVLAACSRAMRHRAHGVHRQHSASTI